MTRTLIVIIGLALLTSCNEKIAKFIFDSSKMSNLTRYSYNFDAGKLTSSKTIYTVMLGQVVDTFETLTNYEYDYQYEYGVCKSSKEYDKKNNLTQIVNQTYFENDKRIGFISVDKTMNFKIVESYSYNEHGDLKEMQSYNEEIKNAL